jgi:DnaJ-class molecular chaperone
MASEEGDREQPRPGGDDQADSSHEPRECMACRGTGQVISHLGGTTSTVTCPWCDGGGVRLTDVDAQARWAEAAGEGQVVDTPPESTC